MIWVIIFGTCVHIFSHVLVTYDSMRSEYLTETWSDILSQEFGVAMEKPIRGDRADLLTRYANPVATG